MVYISDFLSAKNQTCQIAQNDDFSLNGSYWLKKKNVELQNLLIYMCKKLLLKHLRNFQIRKAAKLNEKIAKSE